MLYATMDEKMAGCYASLVVGHGLLPTIGLVVFDCESFEFKIYQYSDMASYLKTLQLIQSHEITQIFVPKSPNENKIPIVMEIIQYAFKNVNIFPFDRVYFNEERGVECIKQYGLLEDVQKLEPSFTSKYYGLSALAALFKYMELYVKTFFHQNSVHITYADPKDPYTCTSLELLRDIDSASLKHSLFYAINNTSTKMGANRLKFNISQPLIDKATIETRLSCIEEMLYNFDTIKIVKKQLETCPDIDFIIKHVNSQTFSIKQLKQSLKIVLISKNGVDLVDGLIENIGIFKNQLLKNIFEELLCVYNSKLGLFLKEYLNDDIDLNDISRSTSSIYIIKYGINGLLDVDMMVSFTIYAAQNSLVKPIFEESTIIKNSKQPVLLECSKSNCIPNDVYFSQNKNFSIITGRNMSGKTTYLKQIAHIYIIAQIGCYIPAESGKVKLVTQMLSLFCHNPNCYSNSSFQQELNRIQYILNNMEKDSLILIDEFGRNTSPEDSIGLLFAICEKLISSKNITFLSTHFIELSIYLMNHPNVNTLKFSSEGLKNMGLDRISWNHKISNGIEQMKNYGLAKQIGYRASFIDTASLISNEVKNHNKGHLVSEKMHKSHNKIAKYQHTSEHIISILKNEATKIEKIDQLNALRRGELTKIKKQRVVAEYGSLLLAKIVS
ncbi:P-loop containing nucleoside triphosphate hydrolase protein [Conidiobolus coronatus NRRL 28638]|uniref:p-loop containing nucleoside triphosphate hydrolase protein n=1 Tax=Conidiobolus coronatus (strain ATCC 28846 / CBS 209.66 / NRRL 28638) TaxID=796925 RepID=A0A137P9Y3_CONC2|nr:P-loop containing nucleoside triphosphate hydrolase protein [Conidiobolus coronatus NRRL 28638]|eukprot:KXN71810.1 P-loop containing nucleoside triphosphate hydrolase protein [Conidiobolus coronatus NRRL 28638]